MARSLRARICGPLLRRVCDRIALTNRELYVYRGGMQADGSQLTSDWKYYTSEVTGTGSTGDDMVWTLVSWPGLKPKDSFTMHGVVGMVAALHDSRVKLLGRWGIVHDPELYSVGPVPALGMRSMLRSAAAKVLKAIGSF
jgi:hypothetical protein